MVGSRIRARRDEEVGKAGHLNPEVRPWVVAVLPQIGELRTVPSDDVDGRGELEMETGGQDDDVGLDVHALRCRDTPCIDPRGGCPMQRGVLPVQSGKESRSLTMRLA